MIPRFRRNNSSLYEKAISWFWVILFISSVLYLRWLLVEMHSQTERLAEQQQQFQMELEEERRKSEKLYREFHAQINQAIEEAIRAFNRGEIPYQYYQP